MNGTKNSCLFQAAQCLSPAVYRVIEPHFFEFENTAQEIRLRVCRPLSLVCRGKPLFFTLSGNVTDLPCGDLFTVSRAALEDTFQRMCDYSVYARQDEIVNGFVTLRGGHRAGVSGTAVCADGKISNVRGISSVNIRVAREYRGCAAGICKIVKSTHGGVLLCGEPCSGKTTMLRDLARLLSNEGTQSVALIDERGELAACVNGEPQNDVGLCDVYDGYPKAEAIRQAVRSMAPQLILCDEIGGSEDAAAVAQCQNCGVRVIATAHAGSMEELRRRKPLQAILDSGAFSVFVFLKGHEQAGQTAYVVSEGVSDAA